MYTVHCKCIKTANLSISRQLWHGKANKYWHIQSDRLIQPVAFRPEYIYSLFNQVIYRHLHCLKKNTILPSPDVLSYWACFFTKKGYIKWIACTTHKQHIVVLMVIWSSLQWHYVIWKKMPSWKWFRKCNNSSVQNYDTLLAIMARVT